ncbi:endonuclease/exonuclease/phosphatase family protein [Agromyces seonyuensis]|uniref:Endonuclease/exonuclease/phosphatase family protein n=1 Tax=Agromyces seonyuensis TaxID=2662446 RepID=A0A6I4P3R7_9MICO|nr:endonuclease/exonuclease/phosphatase family protein [Agromyces seonyuensis]MWC00383.1 endonuclease/exonuclease/phosphatase family protein [Agromyces seonyuensis]
MARFLGGALLVLVAILAILLTWPQLVDLQNQWVFAHVVALRGIAAVCGLGAALVVAAFLPIRRLRAFTAGLAGILVVFAAANAGVLTVRGLGGSDAAPDGSITVLSWNTLGEVPGAEGIAALALEQGADVVVLPETTEETSVEIAVAMREAGRPMWVHHQKFDDIAKARSTTLLISPELGVYDVVNADVPGPPGNTSTLPSVVAVPVDGVGPTIVAVHAVAPIRWEFRNWRADLDWTADQCASGNVIMAGDFNATLDHFAGRGVDGGDLGICRDAALAAGAAGLGTWPTRLPEFLGSPIDHVLATPEWHVDSFEVLDGLDDAGSDHRPVVARLSPVG